MHFLVSQLVTFNNNHHHFGSYHALNYQNPGTTLFHCLIFNLLLGSSINCFSYLEIDVLIHDRCTKTLSDSLFMRKQDISIVVTF